MIVAFAAVFVVAPIAMPAPGPVAFAQELPEPTPVPALPPIAAPDAASTRLVPVPAGCAAPPVEQVVFIGTMVLRDASTARFAIQSIRSGDATGFEVGGLIDVRYGDEVRFLDQDSAYVVGAAVDPTTKVLSSTVREPAPLFGGNEVAGVNNSDVQCPQLDDPVRTLRTDGTSVESGVLTPLKNAKWDIARSVLQPIGVAFVVLFGLAAIKLLLFALGRSLRDMGGGSRSPRRRRHTRAATGYDDPGSDRRAEWVSMDDRG
ncbi:MAG: hypothetical protein JWN99_1967 [Ilumatobacteraceae bacterium]|nr:hypothetical protein [Ilumatobacteraceae bacterium]